MLHPRGTQATLHTLLWAGPHRPWGRSVRPRRRAVGGASRGEERSVRSRRRAVGGDSRSGALTHVKERQKSGPGALVWRLSGAPPDVRLTALAPVGSVS